MCELRLIKISGNPPTSYFAIKHHDNYVGHCILNHEAMPSEHLPKDFTGHIFYEILENYRHLDHTKVALDKLIIAAKHIGIKELYLVAQEYNLPPHEILEGRGAILVNTATGHDGVGYVRYVIQN